MSNKMCKNLKTLDENMEEKSGIKKLKGSIIAEHVESKEFQEIFARHWSSLEPLETDLTEIITTPYKVCKISNFLKNDSLISEIKAELKHVKSKRNNMDLYQFDQTEDLANVQSPRIAEFYRTFKYDLSKWMETNTKINLSQKISMSSATYSDTDYLLCHDDNIGDRRIAFILYLSKNWMLEDGGALDIFDTDENGQPRNIVRSLIPEYNSLVFFEVVDNSYHQVAEINSLNKSRMSINGWFHGPLRESHKQRRPEMIYKYFEPEHNDVDLVSLVSKIYLYESIVKKIQRTIEKDSFIYLPGFIIPERYEVLCEDVKSPNIVWSKIGPADLQNYEIARENTLPDALKEFYNIFKSIHIFHLLKQYTELDLVPETDDMKPKMKIELQRWSCGCYMLINDKVVAESTKSTEKETENNENGKSLDVREHESCENTNDESQNEINDNVAAGSVEQTSTSAQRESLSCKKWANDSQQETEMRSENKSAKGKGKAPLPKKESTAIVPGGTDSSDVEEFLSDSESNSDSDVSANDDEADAKSGTLDVLLQFHTNNVTEDATIDYINPSQKDGALIHIPPQDNHLCIVYRTADTCRCNKYVNHYCEGYFYTLVCSYYE